MFIRPSTLIMKPTYKRLQKPIEVYLCALGMAVQMTSASLCLSVFVVWASYCWQQSTGTAHHM